MQIVCPNCEFSREVPDDKIPPKAKLATCPKCGYKFKFRQEAEEISVNDAPPEEENHNSENRDDLWTKLESLESEDYPSSGEQEEKSDFVREEMKVPWEHLEDYGFFPGFFQTLKLIMLRPVDFFYYLPLGQGLTKPLIFYLLIAEVQALTQYFWQMMGVVPQMQSNTEALWGIGLAGMGSVMLLIFYPILLTFMLFGASAVNHLCLTAVKATSKGFEGTFKVVSYSSAPMILAVVPTIGPIAGMFWSLICTFLGFKYVHRTTSAKVLLAMLLPLIALFFLIGLMMIFRS